MEPLVSNTEPIRVLLVEDEYLISEWVAELLAELPPDKTITRI